MLGFKFKKSIFIKSPIPGQIVKLSEVPDQVFAEKMMGDGFAVIPSIGSVYAPIDAEILFVFKTKHAIGLKTREGLEILIHIGLDTVELNGEGFTCYVDAGDFVKAGDKLLDFDMDSIHHHGKNLISPIVITNLKIIKEFKIYQEGDRKGCEVKLK